MKKNIAIFASGSGTNAERIIRYFRTSHLAQVSLVLSNKDNAYVLERARQLNVPFKVFPKEDWLSADVVLKTLQEYHIDFIVLAGFLLKVPSVLIYAYPDRIVNIHPALLPKFGGKGMYGHRVHEAVVAAGEKETGITIHYINECYDEGNTIFQARCPIVPNDSPDDVAQKVHELEYEYYPQVIERLMEAL